MIKCIIFDVGKVLVYNESFPRVLISILSQFLNIPFKLLYKRYQRILPELETGKKLIFSLINKENIVRFYQFSANKAFKTNEPLLNFAIELKKQYKVGIISNIDRYLSQIPIHQFVYNKFDNNLVILSKDVGIRKPNKKIYHLFLNRINLLPDECLFVDNDNQNIKSAKKIGFKTILFKNNRQFFKQFRKIVEA